VLGLCGSRAFRGWIAASRYNFVTDVYTHRNLDVLTALEWVSSFFWCAATSFRGREGTYTDL
jgi:hypothetical protein